jgi:hypothetical protein
MQSTPEEDELVARSPSGAAAAAAAAIEGAEIITEACNLQGASDRYVKGVIRDARKVRLERAMEAARDALTHDRPYPTLADDPIRGFDASPVDMYPLVTEHTRSQHERLRQSDTPDCSIYRCVSAGTGRDGGLTREAVPGRRRFHYRMRDVMGILLGRLPCAEAFLDDTMEECSGDASVRTNVLALVGNAILLHISRSVAGLGPPLEFALATEDDPTGLLVDLEGIVRIAGDLYNDVSLHKTATL